MSNYLPSSSILENYARVLINFALNSGQGIRPGEVVRLSVGESAKPLYVALRNQILRSQAHVISNYSPDDIARQFYELASPDQLNFFPRKYLKGLADQIDHSVGIISDTNLHELEGIDPQKILARNVSLKPFKDWLDKKENAGNFTWTLALYGTPAMAAEAGLSLEAYWQQIIQACFLDQPDPVATWRQVFSDLEVLRQKLTALAIQKVHVEGPDVDLWLTLGASRKWLGGSGRNIPSFELFISPDWRGTEGHIRFNQPLYRYGNLIEGVDLIFKAGRVVSASAAKNNSLLQQMLQVKNADKVGEFSLTDKRYSRIDHFMAETLFDENISGPFGNTHIALGSSYQESFTGDLHQTTARQFAGMGFNDSATHTDIISTTDRTVTAVLPNGSSCVIYQAGQFTI